MFPNKLKNILIVLHCFLLLLVLSSCGGGANDNSEDVSIFIRINFLGIVGTSPSDNNEYVEVEMVKNVTATTGVVEITSGSAFDSVNPTVGTVVMDSFELTFTRTDGGTPGLSRVTGPLDAQFAFGEFASSEFPIVSTFEKVFGALGQSFAANPRQGVEFQAKLTCYGHNLAGQKVQATTGFVILCGTFLPYDDLLPSIISFNYLQDFALGSDWAATWVAGGFITGGFLVSPFGSTYSLSGSDFPVGDFSLNTSYLLPQYQNQAAVAFPEATLIVANQFGTVQQTGGPVIAVVRDAPTTNPVAIDEFFSSRYAITAGDSVNLSWVVSNGPTGLEMIPSSFSGVPVDFTGKNLSFDSVTVTPEASVRPILRATKSSNQSEESQFLDQPISVTGGVTTEDPTIVFFTASQTSVSLYQQVALYWKVVGDYEKVELFPINGQAKDVTGRESFLTPPLNRMGANPFTLAVTGVGGGIVANASLSVTVTAEDINDPVIISNIQQSPSANIDNGDAGAFSFRLDDPENEDCTWTVKLIAGDNAFFGPSLGRVDGGHGDGSVSFADQDDNNSGHLTFQINAYDNTSYGNTAFTNRSVRLVTFTTNGGPTFNAPVIDRVLFTPGNPGAGLLPGQDGVLSFRVTDQDTSVLSYTVSIIAGDRGGTLDGTVNATTGVINMGAEGTRDVAIQFQDDPDSTDDAVVFKIEVSEEGPEPKQTAIAILRVEYQTTTDGTITFPHIGLYNNGTGTVTGTDRLAFYLNYTGTSTGVAGAFFVDHELTIPAPALSAVLDLEHGSGNPGSIASIEFTRNFISPSTDNENFGELIFRNYWPSPAADTGSSTAPISNGVSRWSMTFDVNSFQSNNGGTYNLPIVNGQVRIYQIDFEAQDEDNVFENVLVTLQVESVN
ncbi:MAG: hypothetical protein H6510_03805 [Acidobacteria bacterium]|nr:hypothetical protein [Acidobacteriota bacterium]MCB9396919.1 hypothetical protein [Acidobacteriota bacterium]